jgi:hypothetical protein
MQSAAYVVMTGGLLREQDIPDDLRGLVRPTDGHSAIIGPNGDIVAGPLDGEEGILTATANLVTCMGEKMIADHAGHYSRPDVFDFRVNRVPKQVARFIDPPHEDEAGRHTRSGDQFASFDADGLADFASLGALQPEFQPSAWEW